MPTTLSRTVPSRSLLRFLRAQNRHLAFFDGSDSAIRSNILRRRFPCGQPLQQAFVSRSLCTTKTRRNAVMEAGLWDLDGIFPRLFRKPRNSSETNERRVEGTRYESSRRMQSTSWGPNELERISDFYKSKAPSLLNLGDLPRDDPSGDSIFSASRSRSDKAASEPRIRCTEVDEKGQVILVDSDLKKTELIAKYGLLPRDLRKIDASNLPHILVRPSSILLNLLHLKVLIKYDRVLLFDVYGSHTSFPQSAFVYDLQGKLQQKQGAASAGALPYEFRALEAVLTSVTSELESEFGTVQAPVIRILSELEDDIDRDKLRVLLVLSKKVSSFEQKAKLVRDAIEELLEADDDLAAMYLTEKRHDLYRGEDDHTEIEMLLESYHKICDEVAQGASNLVSGIRNTEEIIRAILDANRNSLMLLDLKFSVATVGLAMGTFLAGLYGMNLENFIEGTHWGFGTVTGVSMVVSLFVCWYGLTKLRKVQRLKFGASPRDRRQDHWYREHGAAVLLDARNREKLRRMNMLKPTEKQKKWFILP